MQQRHSQFTRHDPRETFRRTTNGHKMRYFQQFIPVEEKFLFPALSRIIKGSFHQLGSVADISAVGKFPGQLFWEVESRGGPRWYGTHPPQGPLALMGSQEPKYSSPMGPIRVPRSGDAGGKARVLSLARPTRLILGGSLGDTHPCSTFATTSSFSFLKHLPDKLNIPRLSMKLDIQQFGSTTISLSVLV